MNKWRDIRLGEYIETLKGNAFKSSLYKNNGIPVVRASNFTDQSIEKDKIVYIDYDEDYERFILEKKDVLCQTVGSWLNNPNSLVGKIVRVPDYLDGSYLNQNIVKIIPDENLDNDYLFYRLKVDDYKHYCVDNAQGAANQASITLKTIRRFKFNLPDLETQEKTADILSTYDELIENNNRRIEILEKTAEEIYKEWFVRMRFPGHEKAKFTKGIPEGWEVKKLKRFSKLVHGYTESADEMEIGPKYLRGTDINKNSYINWEDVPYCEIDKNTIERYKLYKNDMVIIRMADPGKVAIVEKDIEAVFASYLIKIDYDENKIRPYYMFYTLYSEGYQDHIKSFSNGTTRSSINSKMILNSKILVPTIEIQEKFNEIIKIHRNMINKLLDKNQNLIKQRDLLLPRLMNGTIEVK